MDHELDAVPHLGKLFACEEGSGQLDALHQCRVCKVYPSAKKQAFKAYQSTVDPDGLFNYGLGERLLRECCSISTQTKEAPFIAMEPR